MPTNQAFSLWDWISSLDVSNKIAFANCVLTGLFLLATIISVACAFKAYNHQKNRSRKEAACDLAKFYAENIILRNSFVTDVLQFSKLEEKTKHYFPYDELVEFTRDEMISLFKEQNISYEEIETAFSHPDPQSILNVMLLHSDSSREREELLRVYGGLINEEAGNNQLKGLFLQHEFFDRMCDYLNDMEWFSMSCRYGIADEEILYQSLHQSFLSSVWQLYFYICNKNTTNEDKLYTNVIWLFNKWRNRMRKIQKAATDQQLKSRRKIEDAEQQLIAAENELKETKPKVHSGKPLK